MSTWSSGTGASALLSSLCYSTLRQFHVSTDKIMLWLIAVPCLEILVFWVLLRHHHKKDNLISDKRNSANKNGVNNEAFTIDPETTADGKLGENRVVQLVSTSNIPETIKDLEKNSQDDSSNFVSVRDKLKYLPHLIRLYMAPLLFIYFAQYFINQGLVGKILLILSQLKINGLFIHFSLN